MISVKRVRSAVVSAVWSAITVLALQIAIPSGACEVLLMLAVWLVIATTAPAPPSLRVIGIPKSAA